MALENPEQAKLLTPHVKRRSKYSNVKIVVDDEKFDSIAEAALYVQLVNDPTVQRFWIKPVYRFLCGTKYIPDFKTQDKYGHFSVYDAKGFLTDACSIKLKMMRYEYGVDVHIIRIGAQEAHAIVKGYMAGKA